MDQQKDKILANNKNGDFIIMKPDGTVLDQGQAAHLIAQRYRLLDENAAKLAAEAETLGVTNTVAALRDGNKALHPRINQGGTEAGRVA